MSGQSTCMASTDEPLNALVAVSFKNAFVFWGSLDIKQNENMLVSVYPKGSNHSTYFSNQGTRVHGLRRESSALAARIHWVESPYQLLCAPLQNVFVFTQIGRNALLYCIHGRRVASQGPKNGYFGSQLRCASSLISEVRRACKHDLIDGL